MDVTSELTIVIPVRIDYQERRENIDSILTYLIDCTSANIIIMEVDDNQKLFMLFGYPTRPV